MVMGRRVSALSLGWDSERRGGSGCGVLSHWYWQVLKQQVSAPTSWLPPRFTGMARAGTGSRDSSDPPLAQSGLSLGSW